LELIYAPFPILRERSQQKAGSMSGGEQQMLALTLAQSDYVLETGSIVMHGKAIELLQDEGVKKAYLGI
jgi:branched-chain amino acid transport system ATP-binding protein